MCETHPDIQGFVCPQCGGNAFKRFALWHPMLVHWLLNPGLVVNELLLGQRLPRVMYLCLGCDLPWVLRQYIRCPSCRTMHRGLIWGRGNAFWHWFGLYCPDCGARIPTLLNVFSIIIAAVFAPLWYPVWRLVRGSWIERERIRAQRMIRTGKAQRVPVKRWILWGALGWGVPFWVLGTVYAYFRFPQAAGNLQKSGIKAAIMLPVCLLAGAGFGFVMKKMLTRRHRTKKDSCRVCGYSLRGLTAERCPECGFHFVSTEGSHCDRAAPHGPSS